MRNLISELREIYRPVCAIVLHRADHSKEIHPEYYDINRAGKLIMPRSLTMEEAGEVGQWLQSAGRDSDSYLPRGIIPANVLHLGYHSAIWYTPATVRHLLFTKQLKIACGSYPVPALLWFASGSQLRIFALASDKRPDIHTPLFHAPFLNLSSNGSVCMGNASVPLNDSNGLEQTMQLWEKHFFGSYFSHSNRFRNTPDPVAALWRNWPAGLEAFPTKALESSEVTFKSII